MNKTLASVALSISVLSFASCGSSDAEPAAAASSGTFRLELANGQSVSSAVTCTLEPQIAAGQEILYTAVGNGDPYIVDLTVWGETDFGGSHEVEVSDRETFDTLWRSTASTGLVVDRDGTVITASGGFFAGDSPSTDLVAGEVTITC